MADRVIQLQDKTGTDNLYPIAGGMAADSVTKAMLAEGVFEGETLSTPTDVDYVATDNIQNEAVTSAKIDGSTFKNYLKPGDSISLSGSGPYNIKYQGQFNDTQNTADINIPLNVLISSDVTSLSVSTTSGAVTIYPDGGTEGAANISSMSVLCYSFQSTITVRLTFSSTITHTRNQFIGVRIPNLTLTAS